jgi:DNA-binding MarR family transcriptional regulator
MVEIQAENSAANAALEAAGRVETKLAGRQQKISKKRPLTAYYLYIQLSQGGESMSSQESRVIDAMARDCFALRVRTLNRVITNLYDDALRPLGIKISQLNVLVATAKLGLARPRKLCEILQMDTSTLSRNVERMRAKGWLETVAGEDGRAQPFRLTARGASLLEKAIPAWERGQRRAQELLGADGTALLAKTAGKVRTQ